MTFQIVRTDRRDDTKTQVAHDLPKRDAESLRDMLNEARVHVLPSGLSRYCYQVQEQAK